LWGGGRGGGGEGGGGDQTVTQELGRKQTSNSYLYKTFKKK